MSVIIDHAGDVKINTVLLKELKGIGTVLLWGIAGIAILALINAITLYLFSYYVVPHALVAIPIVFLPIMIYRTVVLRFVPEIIVNGTQIRYFNVLWYNTILWEDVIEGSYKPKEQSLYLRSNKQIIKGELDNIDTSDEAIVLDYCKTLLRKYNIDWQIIESEEEAV